MPKIFAPSSFPFGEMTVTVVSLWKIISINTIPWNYNKLKIMLTSAANRCSRARRDVQHHPTECD